MGLVVALVAAFTPIDVVAEPTNIGTLSAFVLVAIGVLVLRRTQPNLRRAFRVPFVPVLPILSILFSLVYFLYSRRRSALEPGTPAAQGIVGGAPVETPTRPLPPAHLADAEDPPARVS